MLRPHRLPGLALAVVCLCAAAAPAAEDAPHHPAAPPHPEHPNVLIGGFTDFDFQANDQQTSGATSGFHTGQFVLHMTSTLSSRFSFFGEVSWTAHDAGYTTEIERSIIKFQANNYLGLSFGRYHTPINWWNTAFHHGQWLQTTVDRPEMARFGGTFIPVHFVGTVAEGVVPMLGADFNYEAGVGNGRADTLSRDGDAGDATNNRAWFTTLAIRPNALIPLDVGGGFYQDLAHRPDGRNFNEDISAAHAVWPSETPEVLAEIAYVRHRDTASGALYENWGDYVQVAYRLPWVGAHFKPYARAEQLRIADGDPVFATIAPVKELTAGMRYDAADFVALKAEFRRMDFEKGPDVNALQLQISCTF
jgi:hypothetical protein